MIELKSFPQILVDELKDVNDFWEVLYILAKHLKTNKEITVSDMHCYLKHCEFYDRSCREAMNWLLHIFKPIQTLHYDEISAEDIRRFYFTRYRDEERYKELVELIAADIHSYCADIVKNMNRLTEELMKDTAEMCEYKNNRILLNMMRKLK